VRARNVILCTFILFTLLKKVIFLTGMTAPNHIGVGRPGTNKGGVCTGHKIAKPDPKVSAQITQGQCKKLRRKSRCMPRAHSAKAPQDSKAFYVFLVCALTWLVLTALVCYLWFSQAESARQTEGAVLEHSQCQKCPINHQLDFWTPKQKELENCTHTWKDKVRASGVPLSAPRSWSLTRQVRQENPLDRPYDSCAPYLNQFETPVGEIVNIILTIRLKCKHDYWCNNGGSSWDPLEKYVQAKSDADDTEKTVTCVLYTTILILAFSTSVACVIFWWSHKRQQIQKKQNTGTACDSSGSDTEDASFGEVPMTLLKFRKRQSTSPQQTAPHHSFQQGLLAAMKTKQQSRVSQYKKELPSASDDFDEL